MAKNIFTYSDKTDLFQLEIAARSLLAGVVKLAESVSWQRFCLTKKFEYLNEAKNRYATTYKNLHQNALAYLDMLEDYVENHDCFEDKSLQDKFLNGEIIAVRDLAVKSINILQSKIDNSKSDDEKTEIQTIIDEIKTDINIYLDILRDILQHDKKLQTILLKRGVNYIEKYRLEDI